MVQMTGCTSFRGGFILKEQQITFAPVAATMMACMDSVEQEQQFLLALEKAERFSIGGENLVLYDADDRVLLRFVAGYLQEQS